jgi:hypothetical protein
MRVVGAQENSPMVNTQPRVLVISEFAAEPVETNLFSLLQEYGQGKYTWIYQTVMDTCMKTLPGDIILAILDVGLITGIHREVLDKLLLEGNMRVLAHVTDDRPGTLKFLREHNTIWYLKKPASLHDILAAVDAASAAENPPELQTG